MEITDKLALFREANKIAKNRKTNGYTRTLSYLVGLQYRITQLTAEIGRFTKVPHGNYTAFDDRVKELGGDIYWYLSQMWNEVHLKSKVDNNHPYFKSEIKLTKEDDNGAPQVWMRSHIDPLVYAVFNKITVLIALVGFTVDDCLDAMVRAIQARE